MRSGAWRLWCGLGLTWALALPVASCSGGYPLPATRCDEWCDVTKGDLCQDYYQPATCVANCEQANIDHEACRALLDSQLRCFRSSPQALAQRCVYDRAPDDCEGETQALLLCIASEYADSPTGKR